ncbi:MAG: DNA polymerase III subunit alpha [Paludibacteraceae bacterium]|nr:DNA polymerase III subunit alpha [Paludibacteraceae bacterium]
MDAFTHLHVHSHYSLLDGMSKVPDLIDKCQRTGMHALALTDHGNMYGIKDLLDTAKKVNGKAKGKVKDCKEAIKKAEEKIAKLPEWEQILRDGHMEQTVIENGVPVNKDLPLSAHDKKDFQEKISDAKKAEKELPLLKEDLPKLEKKAADYIPFKPIVGVEAYCARRSRLSKSNVDKQVTAEGKTQIIDSSGWHLILLAKNMTGYHNLCRIVSLSFIDGFYNRPRIDKQLLEESHEGLICSSACLGGELPQLIMSGQIEEAERSIEWFKSIFGDDYYIEIQRHKTDKPNSDQNVYLRQKQVNPVLIELAKKHNVKVIATNDVHFVEEEHAEAHDRLICLSTNKFVSDTDRMHYTKQEWLKTPEEMQEIFSDIPEALTNTQEIVDKVEVYDIDSGPIMPLFPIPEEFGTEEEWRKKFTPEQLFDEFTQDEKGNVVMDREAAEKKIKNLGGYDKLYRIKFEADYLNKLAWEGAEWRYGEKLHADTEEGQALRDRITFELHIMKTMGFPGYFLIVRDYIRAAREELGVSVGPGRGSAAGSVVAYCLRITDVDPMPYDLLFERFLNPDRISLPDIDVDFDDAGRGKVLDWVSQKYGKTHVAHIITYGTMASKSAIADVGRVQQIPLPDVNRIKSYIPDKFPDTIKDEKGKTPKVNLKNCYKYVDELKDILNGADEGLRTTLTYAEELEDTIRQVGIHACGVIIGADDLTKFAPLATVKDRATQEDIMVTQYDGHVVESVGLIKMDFLGLITLTIIKETLANIKKTHNGLEVDIDHIPVDDELTYKLFAEGKTIATFQFESAGMQKYLRDLKPTVLPDLIAMNALYRPGPMDYIPSFIRRKNGLEPITYDIPIMETYLKDTYGITVYQEQVMLLSRLLANVTRGESDALRKAMGKKKKDIVDAMKPKFIEGGRKNGHDPEVLDKIWSDWEKFASYAFNKSHATCYAWVAYQTGYLKAHFAPEFMAANLTVAKDDITKVTKLMEECKAMGLSVLEPSVNDSDMNFTVDSEGNIRCGLAGIKGVGEGAVEAIVSERKKNGKFKDIFDFVERVSLSACNKKALESMAYAGALDCFPDFYREQLFTFNSKAELVLDTIVRYGNIYQTDKQQQQNSLFGDAFGMAVDIQHPEMPKPTRWSTIERLNKEKEMIGIYLSSHPLDEFEFELKELCNLHTPELQYFDKWKQNYLNAKDPSKNKPRTYTPAEGEPDPQEWLKTHENTVFKLGGLITSVEVGSGFNGSPYGRYVIEDYEGSWSFSLYDEQYVQFGALLQQNAYVLIKGIFQQRGASNTQWKFTPKPFEKASYEFRLQGVYSLPTVQELYVNELIIKMPVDNITADFNNQLMELLMEQKHQMEIAQEELKAGRRHGSIHFPQIKLRFMVFDGLGKNLVHFTSQHFRVNIDHTFYQFLKHMRNRRVLLFELN